MQAADTETETTTERHAEGRGLSQALSKRAAEALVERMKAMARTVAESGRQPPPPKCEACADRKWVEGDGRMVRCSACMPSVDARLLAAGVTPQQLGARLDSVWPQLRAEADELLELLQRRMLLPGHDAPRSVLMHGPAGTGKSWLAAGCARYALEVLGWSVKAVSARRWLQDLRETYDRAKASDREAPSTESDITGQLIRPQLLVIQDLPRERISPWVREQVEGILDERIEACKVTIITTNPQPHQGVLRFHGTDTAQRRRLTHDAIVESYGEPVASRLGERYYEWLEVIGDDLRKQKEAKGGE